MADGIPESEIDTTNTEKLLDQWANNFDPNLNVPGMTFAKQNYYHRLDVSLEGLLSSEGVTHCGQKPGNGHPGGDRYHSTIRLCECQPGSERTAAAAWNR